MAYSDLAGSPASQLRILLVRRLCSPAALRERHQH